MSQIRKSTGRCLLLGAMLVGGCGGDDGGTDLFPDKPECDVSSAIVAYMGTHPMAISSLGIGSSADGFDLDHDGKPDNKLAAVSSIAQGSITDAINNYEIVIPMEFFSFDAAAVDSCVKFAVYLGAFAKDADGDGKKPYIDKGDCNDHNPDVHPGATEVVGNFIDDDCDGKADEDAQNAASLDTVDHDGDGYSMATGDCDDRVGLGMASHPGAVEICGDGLDNDCDGVADRTANPDPMGQPACSPFDGAHPADITLDPLSFVGNEPAISFKDGSITDVGGVLTLQAGPSVFSVKVPVTDGISLDLRITGASIKADIVQTGGFVTLKNGHLGGVIDAHTADTIRGLKVDQIGLLPENSLLDATFANLLGPLLALPKASAAINAKYPGCRTPDIDVDGDGLEAFCDSDPNTDPKVVDVCIDGDGTEVRDVLNPDGSVLMNCTEAQKGGKNRFVDGISVELNFATTQLNKIKPPQ